MTAATARITFQEESFCANLEACMAFLPDYYMEVAYLRHQEAFAPHRGRYQALEDAGSLLCVTARADGELIGLWLAILGAHNHAEAATCAFGDAWYLRPAYRQAWTAWRFLAAIEETVRQKGIAHLILSTTMEHDIDRLYRRRGLRPIERVYYKYLGGD